MARALSPHTCETRGAAVVRTTRTGRGVVSLLAVFIAACAGAPAEAPPPPSRLRPAEVAAPPVFHPTLTAAAVPFSALTGWRDGDHTGALLAYSDTCGRFAPVDPRKEGRLSAGHAVWARTCRQARALAQTGAEGGEAAGHSAAARRFFEMNFQPFALAAPTVGTDTAGVVTGYYEPIIDVRTQAIGPFDEPILPRPADLVSRPRAQGEPEVFQRMPDGGLRPYPDRAAIVASAREPLAWGRRSDVLFLQIQGSGRVRFADGQIVRAAWDGANGKPYRSVAEQLMALGLLPRGIASNAAVKRWLDVAGPDAASAVIARNPRYVFFKFEDITDPGEGPVGAAGARLRPGVSVAVDPAFHSFGALFWIAPMGADAPAPRFGVAQDTGGAIKGPLRGDLFFGAGPEAGARAASVRHRAAWFGLAPRVSAASRDTSPSGASPSGASPSDASSAGASAP